MFQPNSVIAGRYQVIRLVGQGGMSNLYLCYDRKYNNAVVVVKEMTASYSDPKEQQMAVDLFHREAKLLASLNHRHIPKVYDYFQFAGKYYLSMEFIDGEDLAQRLEAQKGPLQEDQVLEWGEQIATVLFYLHKHEPPIVFRDVKPSNIMLCDQGVKLIDFGIARHFDQSKKGDTMRIGSPGYAPPEQYAAQTDPRSDIYALGVTLHHALTGRDPTATQTPFLVPPARDLNPALRESTAAMLARATQLDPADRYQSMLEMKNDIKAILSRDKQSTRVVGAPPAPPPGPAVAQNPPSAAPSGQTASTPSGGGASGQAPAGAPSATPTSAPPATPAAANGPGAGGGPSATGGQPGVTSSPPKKSRVGGWLLVATLLLALGGGLYAVGPSGREQIVEGVKKLVTSMNRGPEQANPEEAIRRLLLSGDPNRLLPLSSQTRLSELTENKQPLYRLNLLAAAISKTPTVVHLLYPESLAHGPREAELLDGAGRALSAINGQGGVEKNLLVVLPRTYPPDGLSATLNNLVDPASSLQQKVIVVEGGSASASLSAESPLQPDFIIPAPPDAGQAWSVSNPQGLDELFQLDADEPSLWAAGPPAPAKSEKVDFDGTAQSLEQLMARSQASKMVLVVEADRLPESLSTATGRLLLLAVGTSDLPQLGPKVQAEAVVLGSPLRPSRALPIEQGMSVSQAFIFDAVALTVLAPGKPYLGLTLNQSADGKQGPAEVYRYRWSSSAWIPISEESRTP